MKPMKGELQNSPRCWTRAFWAETLQCCSIRSLHTRMSNAATPKNGRFDEEWAKLALSLIVMRGRADLQEASLILMSVKPELLVSGKLYTRTVLAPFRCEEVKVMHGEEEDRSAGRLVVPKFPDGTRNEEQGPSSS